MLAILAMLYRLALVGTQERSIATAALEKRRLERS
jgi:hypothetical protein